jgi:hypothetical protein
LQLYVLQASLLKRLSVGRDFFAAAPGATAMTSALTDLESLAERIRLPTGGIAVILWRDKPPQLLVRARGGFSMDHIPLQKAFDAGLVECTITRITANTMAVARAPLPNQDILLEGNTLRGVDAEKAVAGSECLLMEVKATADGESKVVGRRLLGDAHSMTQRLAERQRDAPEWEVHLLQGPRPQYLTRCVVSMPVIK